MTTPDNIAAPEHLVRLPCGCWRAPDVVSYKTRDGDAVVWRSPQCPYPNHVVSTDALTEGQ